ncbi:unnamed protein product [Lactuca saligna]|uniref:Retrotransposon gag domain-containing protein n=1 Tax=Lactuca saligna TaxID=75948 RepID=A0AA35Y6A3_LACSI|nr:unnamed protein product [Lactuca saligna]
MHSNSLATMGNNYNHRQINELLGLTESNANILEDLINRVERMEAELQKFRQNQYEGRDSEFKRFSTPPPQYYKEQPPPYHQQPSPQLDQLTGACETSSDEECERGFCLVKKQNQYLSKVEIVAYRLEEDAFSWWQLIQNLCRRFNKQPIKEWTQMKKMLMGRFLSPPFPNFPKIFLFFPHFPFPLHLLPPAAPNPTDTFSTTSSSTMVTMVGEHDLILHHTVFVVTNIKAHIPILLNLDQHNYDTRREFFSTHCEAYDALDHIDATYDDPTPKSTKSKWKKVDAVIRTWIYMAMSQNLVNAVIKSNVLAGQIRLNIEKLFKMC